MYGRVDVVFPAATVFIIAAGPSVGEVELNDIRGLPTIVVNKSFEAAPWADILYFSDARFFRWYESGILGFAGLKYTGATVKRLSHPAITNLRKHRLKGLALDPTHFCTGNNSGYAAINLAYHTGADRIVLIGFDQQSQNGRHHWHADHPVVYQEKVYRKMIPHFASLVDPLTDAGVECVNTSMDSQITCFPKVPLGTILENCWSLVESHRLQEMPS